MRHFDVWFQDAYKELEDGPFLFRLRMKHQELFYLCNASEDGFWYDDVLTIAMKLLKERFDEGMYEEMTARELQKVSRAIDNNDAWAALSILFARVGYEYEWFSIRGFDCIE